MVSTKQLLPLLIAAGLSVSLAGCASFKEAGEEVDESVEDAGDQIEEAGDEIEEETDDLD